MEDYTYDPTQMEALFEELTSDESGYGYSGGWGTVYKKNPDTGKFEYIEDPKHDTFMVGDVMFYWYHASNAKRPATPVVVASWSSNYRGDDWDEHEITIDATAEDISRTIGSVSNDDYEALYGNGPDTIEEARGEK